MTNEKKDLRFEIKSIAEDGTFTGMAAVYGNTDLQGDVIEPGAFTRTLKDHNGEIKLLWQHDPSKPLGKGKITDTSAGLQIEGRLALGITAARDAYESLKAGIVDGLSIGYDVIRQNAKDGKRFLKELRLFEVSLVTFPANPLATVTAVKSEDAEIAELSAIGGALYRLSRKVSWR
ncbi:MAG: HK97 family phage prohead protease [Terriglobia bacterium]|nr:HK97 family phage prohead protease [Terriglobia bacterium]